MKEKKLLSPLCLSVCLSVFACVYFTILWNCECVYVNQGPSSLKECIEKNLQRKILNPLVYNPMIETRLRLESQKIFRTSSITAEHGVCCTSFFQYNLQRKPFEWPFPWCEHVFLSICISQYYDIRKLMVQAVVFFKRLISFFWYVKIC